MPGAIHSVHSGTCTSYAGLAFFPDKLRPPTFFPLTTGLLGVSELLVWTTPPPSFFWGGPKIFFRLCASPAVLSQRIFLGGNSTLLSDGVAAEAPT